MRTLDQESRRSWSSAHASRPGRSSLRRRPGTRRIGQLDGPARQLARVDLEEAAALVAAPLAVGRVADGEDARLGAHEVLPAPLTAAVVVDRVDVIEAGAQWAFEQ